MDSVATVSLKLTDHLGVCVRVEWGGNPGSNPKQRFPGPDLCYVESLGSLQETEFPSTHFIRSHTPMSGITPLSLPLCLTDQESSSEPRSITEQRLDPELCPRLQGPILESRDVAVGLRFYTFLP